MCLSLFSIWLGWLSQMGWIEFSHHQTLSTVGPFAILSPTSLLPLDSSYLALSSSACAKCILPHCPMLAALACASRLRCSCPPISIAPTSTARPIITSHQRCPCSSSGLCHPPTRRLTYTTSPTRVASTSAGRSWRGWRRMPRDGNKVGRPRPFIFWGWSKPASRRYIPLRDNLVPYYL